MGCFGVEAGKAEIVASSYIPTACNTIPKPLQVNDLGQVTRQGLEPQAENTVNCSTKQQSAQSLIGKTVGKSEIPPDLRQVIDHWESLPSEVKQTILALVKHSRRRRTKIAVGTPTKKGT